MVLSGSARYREYCSGPSVSLDADTASGSVFATDPLATPVSTPIVAVVIAVVIAVTVEVKRIEQVADSRHVAWHVDVIIALFRVGQIVAAAVTERRMKPPVPFHEFHERGMLVVDVADMAAG